MHAFFGQLVEFLRQQFDAVTGARIDGDRKPYRVRVGTFDTRAEAAEMLARLKKQGQKGFVAELGK